MEDTKHNTEVKIRPDEYATAQVGETVRGQTHYEFGFTKREYIAIEALKALLSNDVTVRSSAKKAVEAADALCEELNK